jgi:hypothetical protein
MDEIKNRLPIQNPNIILSCHPEKCLIISVEWQEGGLYKVFSKLMTPEDLEYIDINSFINVVSLDFYDKIMKDRGEKSY